MSITQEAVDEDAADRIWEQLTDSLFNDSELVDQFWHRVIDELPSYRSFDPATLEVVQTRAAAGRAIRDKRLPNEAEREHWMLAGETRARQGVDATDMMQVFRIYQDVLLRRARRFISDSPHREAILFELMDLMAAWTSMGMVATLEGYRKVEHEIHREIGVQESGVVRRALFGAIHPAELRIELDAFGVAEQSDMYAIRARQTEKVGLVDIERYLQTSAGLVRRNGLVSIVDGDVCGFVLRLPTTPSPVPIGVARSATIPGLQQAFQSATRAHSTAVAFGWDGLVDVPRCGLYPAVMTEAEIGDSMVERYVTPILALGENGEVILETVTRYLENDARLQVTADELFLHANTVRYRLTRFEEETDSSLRTTMGLMEAWWAITRYRLKRRQDERQASEI